MEAGRVVVLRGETRILFCMAEVCFQAFRDQSKESILMAAFGKLLARGQGKKFQTWRNGLIGPSAEGQAVVCHF